MPSVQDRTQIRSEELFESPITGPFGGVQSELPPTEIEQLGFSDCRNAILRLGRATARPSYTVLPPFPAPVNEPTLGIANFFNAAGVQIQCVFTPTRLLQFINGNWTEITGPGFMGLQTQLFSWDVLNQKLCFSQGSDIIWTWDGLSGTYQQSSPNAPPSSIIAEIGGHLFAVNPANPQTYLWSGLGDPTDWTSFSSGSNKLVNNLGPIRGIIKLGQYGFGFHQQGIVQIIPTGIGLAPFEFVPIINASQGTIAPFSLDHFDDQGVEYAVYLGVDNVYVFNGSSVDSIGDQPLGDRRRSGARSRILADVKTSNPLYIYGFVTYVIAGVPFRAYWLVIPNVSVWVYNFDEGNWTVFNYVNVINTIGVFFKNTSITIAQLIGAISSQSWTPATLLQNNPFNGLLLGFSGGLTGYIDFTNYSEQPVSITSGKLIFNDRRHKHTVKKYRLAVYDLGATTYTISLSNEKGLTQTKSFSLGTGSQDVLNYVQEFSITGLRIQWIVSWPAGQPGSVVEFCPIYDIGGEQRGGLLDN